MKRLKHMIGIALLGAGLSQPLAAEVLTLEQAIERAQATDTRVKEREHLVDAARALLREASGSDDLMVSVNTFVGIAPTLRGGLYGEDGESCAGACKPRSDNRSIDGLAPWSNLQFAIIKPLHTFGKIENYEQAATGNVAVKQGDVALARGKTALDVSRAYYGLLAARDTRKLLEEVIRRVEGAAGLVEKWLEEGNGHVRQSDLYALQAGLAIIQSYARQAEAVEGIADGGLKLLLGWQGGEPLELADGWIRPLPPPQDSLAALQDKALRQRPEMTQVEAGLRARQALVAAKEAEGRPNVYAGIVGSVAYTPNRSQLDNPHIHDPFNHEGATPVLGLKWDYASGAQPARVAQAQAELDALLQVAAFARQGIPFEVAENYRQAMAHADMVKSLENGSRAARRWMISSYADFEAGLEKADRVMTAFQAYVLAHSEYLQKVFDYNMYLMKLSVATGER